MLATADSLRHLSDRGRQVSELGRSHVRDVFVCSYRLIHRVLDSEVLILTVVHGARELGRGRGFG